MRFRHTVGTITLTPQDASVVAQYNQPGDHGCGLKGWQVGVARSVAGRTCAPFTFAAAGTTLYDAAWHGADGAIRLGALPMVWTNDSPAKRPTAPLPPVYRMVKP